MSSNAEPYRIFPHATASQRAVVRASIDAAGLKNPLVLAKQMARRITQTEHMEANLRMFKQLGLDIDDVHTMAESVGLEADDLLLLSTRVSVSPIPRRIVGKPGRRKETKDIANFAAVRRERGMTWNEIYVEWKKQYPADNRVKNPDTIREAYRRHYGDKAKKGH